MESNGRAGEAGIFQGGAGERLMPCLLACPKVFLVRSVDPGRCEDCPSHCDAAWHAWQLIVGTILKNRNRKEQQQQQQKLEEEEEEEEEEKERKKERYAFVLHGRSMDNDYLVQQNLLWGYYGRFLPLW